ncbi:MAG TPA: ABC transporter ATP-binding protein [Longimicrobiales bacterium]|nr:ABC transporter ATP-binding protein [Longimicrobiales bacterium]
MESGLAVRCAGLVKRYGDVLAVDDVDLDVRRGECFGLLGPNGAGKTTTVEILEGLIDPGAGEVEVLGLRWSSDETELRQRLGVSLQETRLAEKLTVSETLRLFRSFYRRGREVDELLDTVQLTGKRDARVRTLSGGQRQRLAVACGLVGEPDLLFLDEPTTGLDPQSRRSLWDVIERFLGEGGTVVLTTHDMEEAARLSDRIAIMDQGQVIATGTPQELVASLGAEHVVEFTLRGEEGVALDWLADLPGVTAVHEREGGHRLRVREVHGTIPALLEGLADRGLSLADLSTHHATLEDVFLSLTGRRLRDG